MNKVLPRLIVAGLIVIGIMPWVGFIVAAQKPVVNPPQSQAVDHEQMYEYIIPNLNSPEWIKWNERFTRVPVDQRVLFFRAWKLGDIAVAQEENIRQLNAKLAALEKRVDDMPKKITDTPLPNLPADPNGKK